MKKLDIILYGLIIILYTLSLLLKSSILDYLLLFMVVCLLAMNVFGLKSSVKYIAALLICASMYTILTSGINTVFFFEELKSIVNILCLMPVIQFIGMPLLMMDLEALLFAILGSIKKPLVFSFVLALTVMFLGSFIHVAAVPIVYNVAHTALRNMDFDYRRYLGVTLKQGFAMMLVWAPFSINMGILLKYVPVNWSDIALPLFIFALTGICASCLCEYFTHLRKEKNTFDVSADVDKDKVVETAKKLIKYISCVLVFIILMDRYSKLVTIDILIICSLTVPAAWAVINKKHRDYKDAVKEHFIVKVPNLKNLYIIITAAGLLMIALRSVGFDEFLNNIFLFAMSDFGVISTMLLLIFIMMLSTWIGLHPFIAIAIICQNLDFTNQVVGIEIYAYSLLVACSLANLVSPTTVSTVVISSLVDKNVFEVGVKWNLLFITVFLLLFIGFLFIALL